MGAIIVGMNNKLKSILSYILGGALVLGGIALVGALSPTVSTTVTNFYTLSDIYNKINSGTPAGPHTVSTTTTPDSSMVTLTQIYESIPNILTLSDSPTAVPYGIYATTTLDTVDTDLVASNITTGTNVFGIIGSAII